ncbi:MAG: TPR end-of-group domain-containing protein, partial [bacterium]
FAPVFILVDHPQLSAVPVIAVIGCGAGFDLERSTAAVPFTFIGVCGLRDMNYLWLQTLNATLLEKKASSRVILFEGEHHWPPAEICRQAIQWVELASYRRGRRPLDDHLVEELYQSERNRARELEEAGKYFQAYLVQLDLRSDFKQLHDLDEVSNSIKLLAGTERLRESWKAARELEQEESRYLKEVLAEFLDTERRRSSEWWKKKIKKASEIGKWTPDLDHQLMAERVLDSLWRNGYERAWLASLRQDYKTAVYFAEIAALVMPESSEVLYNLARMYAFNRQQQQAIKTLQTAVRLGLKSGPKIEKDEAFNELRQLPELKSILEAVHEDAPEE